MEAVRAGLEWAIAVGQLAVWTLLAAASLHLLRSAWWALRHPLPKGRGEATRFPAVTVQLPLRNERYVAERLLRAACALDWPPGQLEVQALDDSDDETCAIVDRVAAELRAEGHELTVLRRPDRAGHKAGNLAHGLRHARGEFFAVLDADSLPPRDFLRRLMSPLETDERVAFAQARWSYLNERAGLLERVQALILDGLMGVEQPRLSFLGWLLPFNGTAGIWRRSALEAAGGWLGASSVTEDLDLATRAAALGYRGVQREEVAVATELPSSMSAFRAQQERWVRGAAEVLRSRMAEGSARALPLLRHLLRHARQPLLVALCVWLPWVALGKVRPAFTLPHAWPSLLALALFSVGSYYAAARARLGRSPAIGYLLAPLVVALSIGLSLTLTVALAAGLADPRRAEWVPTPKSGGQPGAAYPRARSPLAVVEAAAGLGYLACVGLAVARADWLSAAGLALVATGWLWVGFGSLF